MQSFYSLRRFLLDVFSGKRYNHFIRYGGTESDFSSSCIVLKGMIDMKKGLSLLLSGCLMLGMLAGCGSSAAPADTAAPASEATTAPAATEAAVPADSAAEATTSSDKTWVIATDTVFKPFEYTDESGSFVGIDVDIMAAIAEDQGFKYELKSLGWDAAIAACQAGQADGMIAGASITDERKESGWMFSDGYYTATQCMAVAENSDIKGFEDLKDKQVAVKTGTQGASYAESLKDEYGFTLNYFEDSPTMYQAVAGGQAVACFEDTPIMAASIKDGGLGLKIVEGSENDGADYGFAVFNSDEQELLDMFNAGCLPTSRQTANTTRSLPSTSADF